MKRCCEECKFFGPCISCTDPFPKATTVDPVSLVVRSWIRWFPAAVAFLGLAFVAWTIVMVVFVGRYHDAVGRMDNRVKMLEQELVRTKEAYDGEYYGRQCRGRWGDEMRGEK